MRGPRLESTMHDRAHGPEKTGLVLGFGHGVHLSGLVDTIVAAYAVDLKGGMAGRLHRC